MTRRPVARRLLAPGLAAALLLAGILAAVWSGPAPSLIGAPAPPLRGEDLDGQLQDLTDLRGQVVVVNVWASWCPPCEAEIPILLDAQRRYADQGLAVLGIATQDRPAAAREAAAAWGADAYPSIPDADGKLAVTWGTRGVPETFVVDRDGVVVERHIGPVTAQWLDDRLEPVMRR
jgi:DsbE subfamily thiol:disulfide oxidoreductase